MPNKRSTAIRDRFRAQAKRTRAACHLCGQPLDYDLPYTDPKSFVADHVQPLARGGADALSNLAAAHRQQPRACNSTKRARIHAPIIKRSGTLD